MSLVGTIAGGAEGIGVFLDTTTRGVLRLKLGEAHEGWVLRAVRRREATLQKGSQVAVLTLPPPEMSKAGFGSPALGSPGLAGPGLAPPNRAPQGAFPAQGDPGNAAGASLPPASNASGPSPAQANPFAFPTPVVPAAATANPMRDQQTNRR
jgi:general secretion pathway protein N